MIIYLIYIRAVRGVGQILDENSTKFGKIVITRKVLLVFNLVFHIPGSLVWFHIFNFVHSLFLAVHGTGKKNF